LELADNRNILKYSMSQQEPSLSEQHEIRLEKLEKLRNSGVDPYPYEFEITHQSKEILKHEDELIASDDNKNSAVRVSVAGRVMSTKNYGESIFFQSSGFSRERFRSIFEEMT
jgi:lysyl-tRNA synthetase, class II